MAIVTYPLNGIDFSAENAETYLCTRTSGVFSSDGNFKASVTGDRQVTISPGLAWIKNSDFSGKSVCNTAPVPVEIPIADGTRPRIDRIVLRFDKAKNESSIVLKHGTPSSTPAASSVERTELVYELGLCTVYIKASSTIINNGDVTSTLLDESVCGLMRDGVTGIPTSQLQEQVYDLINDLREVIAGVESGAQMMLKAVYDPDSEVVESGGIPAYTANVSMLKKKYDPSGAVLKAGGIPAYTSFNREPMEIQLPLEEIHEKTMDGDFIGLRVGDYKTMTLTTGELVDMQIAGINVYKNHGDSPLGNHIIWLSRDCLEQTYPMRPDNINNGTSDEKNPFRASALFSTLQNTIFPTIPEEWRNIIGNMRCLYGERYSSSGILTADTGWAGKDRGRLILPSVKEVFGNNGFSEHFENGGGGLNIQWPIFIGGNVIKGLGRGGPRSHWWLCSAYAGNSTDFCYVNHGGNSDHCWATDSRGVPLGFITI